MLYAESEGPVELSQPKGGYMRSLGSSLVAKGGVGGKYREIVESNIEGQPADKGQVGTVSRNQIEEPLARPVSDGSNKVVAAKPIVEAAFGEQSADLNDPTSGLPATPSIVPGIGLGPTPAVPGGVVRANAAPSEPIVQDVGMFSGQPVVPGAPNPSQPPVQPPIPTSPTGQQGQVLGAFQAAPSRNIPSRLPTATGFTGGRAIVDRGPLRSKGGNQLRSGAFA